MEKQGDSNGNGFHAIPVISRIVWFDDRMNKNQNSKYAQNWDIVPLNEKVDRCRLKANAGEINWSNGVFRFVWYDFVKYFYTLESWPLADYVLIRSVCILLLNL